MLDFIAISESTPGPFAINVATFVGFSQSGFLGAICATIGVILPSIIIIIIISMIIEKFLKNRFVKYGLMGVRPVVVGLILAVSFGLIFTGITKISSIYNISEFDFNKVSIASIIIMVICFVLSRFKKLNKPILLILISAILGIVFYGLFHMV